MHLLRMPSTVSGQYRTRTEAIEAQPRDHQARLWPERESPLVGAVNGLVERGLYDGARSRKGANGAQFVLGGTRSGQGMSVGVGYLRTDLWPERLAIRGTARIRSWPTCSTPRSTFTASRPSGCSSISIPSTNTLPKWTSMVKGATLAWTTFLALIAKKREESSARVLTKEPLGLCLERCFQTKHQTTRGPYSALETISISPKLQQGSSD